MKPEKLSLDDVKAISELVVESLTPIVLAEAWKVAHEEHARWVREQVPVAPAQVIRQKGVYEAPSPLAKVTSKSVKARLKAQRG